MSKLFISHSSQGDAFVRELQQALGDLKQDVWIDSRQLRGGDPLRPEIQKGIEEASAYAVVVSPDALQSRWVGKELRHAFHVQKQRGKDRYPVIPLSLDGTKLGVLEEIFGEEPVYIPVSSGAGGIDAALNAILVAMGKRLPADVVVAQQPKAEPLEELVLELTDLKFHEQDGVRRAQSLSVTHQKTARSVGQEQSLMRIEGAGIRTLDPREQAAAFVAQQERAPVGRIGVQPEPFVGAQVGEWRQRIDRAGVGEVVTSRLAGTCFTERAR